MENNRNKSENELLMLCSSKGGINIELVIII